MYVILEGNDTALQVDYDDEQLDLLVEQQKCILLTKTGNNGEKQSFIYNPISGPIKCIKYSE